MSDEPGEPPPAPPLPELTTTGAKVLLEAIRIRGVALEQILAKVECIPCMSEACDGPDGEPETKHRSSPTRCYRCAALRIAMSIVYVDGRLEEMK